MKLVSIFENIFLNTFFKQKEMTDFQENKFDTLKISRKADHSRKLEVGNGLDENSHLHYHFLFSEEARWASEWKKKTLSH